MHRMSRRPAVWAIAVCSSLWAGTSARADLLKVTEPLTYPVIAADVNGRIDYHYDAPSGTGTFALRNTPLLLASGSTQSSAYEFTIDATSAGDRYQQMTFKVDASTGKLIDDPTNSYSLYGKVTATIPVSGGGTTTVTYDGLLLQGTPTAFGSLYKGPSPMDGIVSVFDVALEVTGGLLASYFSTDSYIRVTPLRENTFHGDFAEDFYATKAASNTMALSPAPPFPIPEPTPLLLLIVGGCGGLLIRNRHRLRNAGA